MKKDASFEWDEQCQAALDNIKAYITKPPVLASSIKRKPLVLSTTTLGHSLGVFLTRENAKGKKNVLHYLSLILVGPEKRYSLMEKMCLALIVAIQKLCHFLQHHHMRLISKEDPLKYILNQHTQDGHLAKWAVLLQQYDIETCPRRQ